MVAGLNKGRLNEDRHYIYMFSSLLVTGPGATSAISHYRTMLVRGRGGGRSAVADSETKHRRG